jgi:NADH dehydrogenase
VSPVATPPDPRPHVVILGGGFGGLAAARGLADAPVRITLVDRRNHHLFQPLLYQVATAALNPSDIAAPIRGILRHQDNVTVLYAEARSIDVAARRVVLDTGELAYDFVVVATGATHSYFGHHDWAAHAPGLKTLEDALDIRRRVLSAYEVAERDALGPAAAPREDIDAWLTFVVVGAGPTGVELAGALAEISRHALERDFRKIDPQRARIVLVEGGPRPLASFSPTLSEKARRQLEELGVEVRDRAHVTRIDEHGVEIGTERIASRTVLWAAGVAASPLGRTLGAPTDAAGRVKVTERLTIPGHDEVFVIGDLAAASSDGKAVPGLCPAAMQGGRYAALAIRAALARETPARFHYVDKGTLATIGRSAGVAQLGRVELSGFVAWAAWLFIHLLFLVGFRNRVLVLLEWAWAYVTYRRGARLITGAPPRLTAADGERDALPRARSI